MSEHIVATVDEIRDGERKYVKIKGRSIGVFNINGEYFALRNVCPHQGAPVCEGSVGGMTICDTEYSANPNDLKYVKEGEILRCPWHGWEFDIKTGKSIVDPQGCLVKQYKVTVEDAETIQPQLETYPVKVKSNYIILHM